jgi:DNA-binding XRE family transcriptional regulator
MAMQTSNHQCAGDKIRQQRIHLNMTQEKLAAMSNTNVRTVQRAEGNASVQMETVASIAAALKLTVSDIIQQAVLDGDGNKIDEFNAVVLRPIVSGKILMDMICDSFSAKLTCNAEPTTQNIDALSVLVERIEGMLPDPWRPPMEDVSLSLAERLRLSVTLAEQLSGLEKADISVYAGTYTASAQVPRYDMDEGHMYIRGGQRFEPVTACRVLVDRSGLEFVVHEVADKWEQPPRQAPKLTVADDEIPF